MRGTGAFLAFTARQHVEAEKEDGDVDRSVGKVLLISESVDQVVTKSRSVKASMLELGGHAGMNPPDSITVGGLSGTYPDFVSPKNAKRFGRDLKRALNGRSKAIIILSFCLTGTYTKQDQVGSAKSLAQIVANETGAIVISPGGFMEGSFAFHFGTPPDLSFAPKTHGTHPTTAETNWEYYDRVNNTKNALAGIAFKSADDVWYLTTPDPKTPSTP